MLINIRKINADKVQQLVEGFLTKKKYISIFCLTETQVKSIGFKTQGIKMHTKERGEGEKKGGGLAIGYIENKMIELEEKDTGSNDVMVLEGLIYGENIRIILTYMDCSKMKSGKNYDHNRRLQKIIEKWMEVDPGTMLVCLGDFNARMRDLETKIRQSDENGKMIEEWTREKGLHHLNQQKNCTGVYTFGRTIKAKSAIDHVLVNDDMISKFKGMDIDEDRIQIDISDHNLIRAWFNIRHDKQENWKGKRHETITYYKTDKESLGKMENELMQKIHTGTNFNKLMDRVELAQDKKLKQQKRIRIGKREDKYIKSAAWINEEILINQKLRQILNAKWRKARKNKKSKREIESLEKDYRMQQKSTSILIGITKGAWERKRIEEATETNGKSMWKVIQEVLGNRKSKNADIYIYEDKKNRKKIEDIWDPFIHKWKTELYQKQKRELKEKWYGTSTTEGFKKTILREEEILGENSNMMEMPILKQEDLNRIIGNQKNGKAAGTDHIKTEVLKHLIKNGDFGKITTEAINKIHKGKIHRRMKETRTTMLQKNQTPGIMDWRPIAVGSIMSKTICTFYREKIEEHLKDK